MLPGTLRKRRAVQRRRTVSSADTGGRHRLNGKPLAELLRQQARDVGRHDAQGQRGGGEHHRRDHGVGERRDPRQEGDGRP